MMCSMTWLIALASFVCAAPEADSAKDGRVAAAIESFERPWTPEPRTLAGLTVAVTPDDAESSSDRVARDLAELTCGYVEQLAKRASAGIVCAKGGEARRDIVLKVRFTAGGKVQTVAGDFDNPFSLVLAQSVRGPFIQQFSDHSSSSPTPALPEETRMTATCIVSMGYVPAQVATAESMRRFARDRATRIVRGAIEYSRRLPPSPVPYRDEDSVKRSRLARTIWPEGDLPSERVEWFCRMYGRIAITNRSLVYFKPTVTVDGDEITIGGATNVPSVAKGLLAALGEVGISNAKAQLRTLPDDGKLGGKRLGVCVASHVITLNKPSPNAGQQTQLLYGEPVFLLDREAGYYLLHAGDGYWGWAPESAIATMSAEAFDAYNKHDRAVVQQDIELGHVMIPRGARVAIEASANGEDKVAMILADGKRVDVDRAKMRLITPQQQADAASRVASGLDLLYTPYTYGGRSPLGLDCSGLVGMVCAKTGAAPARDAWQLAFSGSISATSWHRTGLQAGDIVFFINPLGKVYHTGVAINSTHIVDSSPPAVQIGSIKKGDRLYDKRMDRDFFVAKRP